MPYGWLVEAPSLHDASRLLLDNLLSTLDNLLPCPEVLGTMVEISKLGLPRRFELVGLGHETMFDLHQGGLANPFTVLQSWRRAAVVVA